MAHQTPKCIMDYAACAVGSLGMRCLHITAPPIRRGLQCQVTLPSISNRRYDPFGRAGCGLEERCRG